MGLAGNRTLRQLREILGLSQQALADKAGLSRVYISQVENGWFNLGHTAALAIQDAFGREMEREGFTLEQLLRDSRPAA